MKDRKQSDHQLQAPRIKKFYAWQLYFLINLSIFAKEELNDFHIASQQAIEFRANTIGKVK